MRLLRHPVVLIVLCAPLACTGPSQPVAHPSPLPSYSGTRANIDLTTGSAFVNVPVGWHVQSFVGEQCFQIGFFGGVVGNSARAALNRPKVGGGVCGIGFDPSTLGPDGVAIQIARTTGPVPRLKQVRPDTQPPLTLDGSIPQRNLGRNPVPRETVIWSGGYIFAAVTTWIATGASAEDRALADRVLRSIRWNGGPVGLRVASPTRVRG